MKLETSIPKGFVTETPEVFVVSKEAKKLWAVQLDLLSKIDAICRKHGIRYSIDSGTLLGAKRHGGYIPWDDDIDVIMPRPDFEKFELLVESELSGYYFYQNAGNSPWYLRPFSRLLNRNTVAVLKTDMANGKLMWDYQQSVFVDIFIADNIPDGEEEREKHFETLRRLRCKYWTAREFVKYARNWRQVRRSIGTLYKMAMGGVLVLLAKCGINLVDKWFGMFNAELTRYNEKQTRYMAPYIIRPYEILESSDFDNLEDVEFEFLKVKAFRRYETILAQQYGDWHQYVIGCKVPMFYDLSNVEIDA